MGRLQLAIDVGDLDEAIGFYTRLFSTPPAKVKEGYANFAIVDPPLKLVLFEKPGAGGTLNHLGVEVETAAEVVAAEARIADEGLDTTGVGDALCCFAEKTETWVVAPDDVRWEWYVKTGDSDQFADIQLGASGGGSVAECCAPEAGPTDGPSEAACCG